MAASPPDRQRSDPVPLAPLVRRAYGTATLPAPLTALVGREGEIATLTALLHRPDIRLLTLIGPGGVGKTRLALEVAGAVGEAFVDGVVLVALGAISDPALIPAAMAEALDLRESADRPLMETIVAALRGQHLLLVLDNLEHVAEASPLIAQLLAACPMLTVLATSRAILHVSGEHDFPVSPLALPDPELVLTAETAASAAAIQLFVARARALRPEFALTAANAATIAAICRRVDGLPLAIELAAARITHLPVGVLLAHLEAPLAMLTGGPRDQPTRLRTLRDAIAWSYDLLPPDERLLFRYLAVFVGGFTLNAAEWVMAIGRRWHASTADQRHIAPPPTAPASRRTMPKTLDLIGALVEKSLLVQYELPSGEPRYGMLETIREYALERLASSSEEGDVRAAHASYYLRQAEDAAPHLIVAGSAHWVERLATERANLQAAVTWALDHGESAAVLRLSGTILSFAYARGEPREGQAWLEAALAADAIGSQPRLRVDALFTASALAQVRGDFAHSTVLSEEGLALARRHGYAFGQARALLALGITAEWQGDLNLAAARYEESRALMAKRDDPERLPHWSLLPSANLADVALLRDDPVKAATLAEEAVAGWRQMGYLWGIAQALGTAAAAASERGDQVRAARLYDETLTLWLDSDDGRGIAGTLAGIAGVANHRGQYERAARLLGAAWGVADALGVRFLAHHVHAERVLAVTRAHLGDEAFNTAWTTGRRLATDQAVGEARRILAVPPPVRQPTHGAIPSLTPRERDVLHLLVAGDSDREIAAALRVSPRTVQTHVARLFAKFGVDSRVEVTAFAVRHGLA